jgi:hypothetical protein
MSSYLPAAQMLHAALPAPGCTQPLGHEVQDVAAGLGMYEPAPQQTAEPAGRFVVPAGQFAQFALDVLPAGPDFPVAHCAQPLWPAPDCDHPPGQLGQDLTSWS